MDVACRDDVVVVACRDGVALRGAKAAVVFVSVSSQAGRSKKRRQGQEQQDSMSNKERNIRNNKRTSISRYCPPGAFSVDDLTTTTTTAASKENNDKASLPTGEAKQRADKTVWANFMLLFGRDVAI